MSIFVASKFVGKDIFTAAKRRIGNNSYWDVYKNGSLHTAVVDPRIIRLVFGINVGDFKVRHEH